MTARAGTEVEVANLALAHLGERAITSLDDNNARARAIKTVYATTRDAVLQKHHWPFATGYATPAEIVPPLQGWSGGFSRRFALPEECLKVRYVQDTEADQWETMVERADPAGSDAEVKVLATDIAAPKICFTRRIEVPRLWSPQFVNAFSHALAGAAAPQIARSVSKAAAEKADAKDAISSAAMEDSKEKSRREVSRHTSWTRAGRTGGGRGRS